MDNNAASGWPEGGGEMASAVRAFNWAATPLGPVEAWPDRLRMLVELVLAARQPMCVAVGNELRLVYNDACRTLCGHPQALGRSLRLLLAEGWAELAPLVERALAGQPQLVVDQPLSVPWRHARPRGRFTVSLVPVRGNAGALLGLLVWMAEMPGKDAAASAPAAAARPRGTNVPTMDGAGPIAGIDRDAEQRLTALMEGIPHLVWRAAPNGGRVWSSPQWSAFTGQTENESRGAGWLDAVHPDDRGPAAAAWTRADTAGSLDVEYRLRNTAQQRYRWFQNRAIPVRNEGGVVLEWVGTSTDVEDLRRLQERQQVTVAELQHRTRNLIHIVSAVAGETLRSSGTLAEFRGTFNGRLAALSRVQGLLSRSEQEPVLLGALLRIEFEAVGAEADGHRLVLDGPVVELQRPTVQTLALALHELATNARKYGALATRHGRLRVDWRVDDVVGSGKELVLEWTEAMPPGSVRPANRLGTEGGYGRKLIEQALPYVLDARTSYVLNDTGVRCIINLPLAGGAPRSGEGAEAEDGHGGGERSRRAQHPGGRG